MTRHSSSATADDAERSSAAMSRTFSHYRPRPRLRRHPPPIVRVRDAAILGVLAVLVMVRWLVMEPPRAAAAVVAPRL